MRYGNRFTWKMAAKSPITLLLLLILFIVLARSAWKVHQKAELSVARLSQAQIELNRLTEREKELSSKVNYLSTADGLEAEIRTKYHAVKQGESVAVIIEDNKAAAVDSTQSNGKSFFNKILSIFGIGN